MVVVWMVAGALGSAGLVAAAIAPENRAAVLVGMAGPLVSACATWLMIAQTLRRQPAALTQQLMRAFIVKVVFFLSYVVVAVRGFSLPANPFVISFAAYFIVLHQVEAILLRRRHARMFHAGA